MEILAGKCSLYSKYLVQSAFLLLWERRSPTSVLLLALHPWLLPITHA